MQTGSLDLQLVFCWCIFQVMGMGFGPHSQKGGMEVSTEAF